MDLNRSLPREPEEDLYPFASKRQRTCYKNFSYEDSAIYEAQDGLYTARSRHYTVAWICALPIEMAAARAMLDDLHDSLPTHHDDINTYVLGKIGRHNVVIACLPGLYGTNNAANVASHLKRTFPCIRAALMVGIAGGAPTMADLHLGDVVVGTRVMQSDLGKIVGNGRFDRNATPRYPGQLVSTAVSALRARHELEPSRMAFFLQERLAKYPRYNRPEVPDHLFHADYEHASGPDSCDTCDKSRLVMRHQRPSTEPKIHHGAIASGNQVMRCSRTRDEIAHQFKVICFEMEAAGLMDTLPCLPVRGICDYSDSHKNETWQRYAAATAAAYARELLELLSPVAGTQSDAASKQMADPTTNQPIATGRREELLASLQFEQMDARQANIQPAQARTCRWLLKHEAYEEWLDPAKRLHHHGFLWIRGKAGAGKSTMMKFLYSEAKKKSRGNPNALVASFFFNARGELLEKSIVGMYRSLLYQLLERFIDLRIVLDDTDTVPRHQQGCPSLNSLKELFRNAVSDLGQRSLTCFVDALDECDEQQVREMVQFFEDVAEHPGRGDVNAHFRICFSSRPYPYIDVRKGVLLTLEDQPGHGKDLAHYIESRLRITRRTLLEDLIPEILRKSAGIFMWVVLVVDILNKEMNNGSLALKKKLAEIPQELSDLFRSILRRDQENMERLQLSILWTLCAERPLTPREFSHALWVGLASKNLVDSTLPDTADEDTSVRLVTSSSKGLVEVTKSKHRTVQFIHESVRDFLIKDKGLQEMWPDLVSEWEGPCHDKLKYCCHAYLNQTEVHSHTSTEAVQQENASTHDIATEYPFLLYASRGILYHANAAAATVPQGDFLSRHFSTDWITIANLSENYKIRRYSSNAPPLYMLADRGLAELIRTWAGTNSSVRETGERYKYPLFAAVAQGHKKAVAALLDLPSNAYDGIDITKGLGSRNEFKMRTPLTWAAREGQLGIVRALLESGIEPNEKDKEGYSPLEQATFGGQEEVVRLLIEYIADDSVIRVKGRGAFATAVSLGNETIMRLLLDHGLDANTVLFHGQKALVFAARKGREAILRLLLDKGLDVNTVDENGGTLIILALRSGHEVVARLLIERGADTVSIDGDGQTALVLAVREGYATVVRLLLDQGRDVNTVDKNGQTLFALALRSGHEAVVRLLVDRGADINSIDEDGQTALTLAIRNGHEAVVRLLIDRGVDINSADKDRQTVLILAVRKGHQAVARLLIDRGADINSIDEDGQTALTLAVRNGHEAVVRLLIDRGAEFDSVNEDGRTALILAVRNGHEAVARLLVDRGADVDAIDEDGRPVLHWVSLRGYEELTRLLMLYNVNVDAVDKVGRTSLMWAASNSHEVAVRLLIDRGANVNIIDEAGRTALMGAANNGHEAIVKLLIHRGSDVNAVDKDRWASLTRAASNGHKKVMKVLIDHGADVNIVDRVGWTPFLWARKKGLIEVMELLIEGGADTTSPKDVFYATDATDAASGGSTSQR